MYTSGTLIDIHTRAHQCFHKLLDHCAGFSQDELSSELTGFGYSSIRLQLHHVIGSEEYWIGVVRGLMLVDELRDDFASIEALASYRARVADVTAAYLQGATEEELNVRRKMTTWGGHERDLVPAHIVIRTQTHIFHHQGQVAAICRLLGRPFQAGFDFPLI